MEAGRNPNLLKLDVRSVEMFRQKSLISNQEAPRARSDDGFNSLRNENESWRRSDKGEGGGGRSSRPWDKPGGRGSQKNFSALSLV